MNHLVELWKRRLNAAEPPAVGKTLVDLVNCIRADMHAALEKDPAARSWLEVLTCYPGLQAVVAHRVAHILYCHRFFWLSRFLAYIARWVTGVDIHPGAKLGVSIFIDHAMGAVIGETTIIGDGALIYQGVTLGGTGKEKGKRHPTLGNNVIIGAGATVLGNIKIGHNTRIGAGSVILHSVPNDCTVVGIPGRVICQAGERVKSLDLNEVPDALAKVVRQLAQRMDDLEGKLLQLSKDQLKATQPVLDTSYSRSGHLLACSSQGNSPVILLE